MTDGYQSGDSDDTLGMEKAPSTLLRAMGTADHKEAVTQKIESYKVSLFNTIAEVGVITNEEALRNGSMHTAFKRIEAELDIFRNTVLGEKNLRSSH